MATYTLARIDAAGVTKAGLELFNRLPSDMQLGDIDGRIRTIMSLMARNGAKAWRAMEEGSGASPRADLYYRRGWSVEGEARAAEFAKADKANEEWVKHWERVKQGSEERLNALAALLSELTGHSWRIDTSGGGMGDVLVIPATVTGARDNCTTYHTEEPAIWLSGN
jgi:hypothetical protein